jgi:hypothetical protein
MDIQQVMHSEARHAGIQKIQNIFRENAHRMYHWAQDRAIPADNNFEVRANFKACLDVLARDPKQDPYQVLFSLDSS